MKKIEIVDSIVSKVDHAHCFITRIYGVGCGVGYDLDINLFLKTNGAIVSILAHATRASWASVGHLRPDNPYYLYSGSCDRYRERVINYWEHNFKDALREYYMRFTKPELLYALQCFENKMVWGTRL